LHTSTILPVTLGWFWVFPTHVVKELRNPARSPLDILRGHATSELDSEVVDLARIKMKDP
jgi:hypothetical protein